MSLIAIHVKSPDFEVTSTNSPEPSMIRMTFQSIAGMKTGMLIWCPFGIVIEPKGRMLRIAPSDSEMIANSPTMTDFLACIFSSSARPRIIRTRIPVKR